MSSSIFFKFKSQKEPSQITFDGTSLSVFEVKRDIIALSKLGDGTDFDLEINTSDTNEREYMLRWSRDEASLTREQAMTTTLCKSPVQQRSSPVACPPQSLVRAEPHDMSLERCL
jgi:hypothetical protein